MNGGGLVELPVSVPLFFAEAFGYRGKARFVAIRWLETSRQLWFTDDGHAVRGRETAMRTLWRRGGGRTALERYRTEASERGVAPWLLIDRAANRVALGSAADVWRLIESQCSNRGN